MKLIASKILYHFGDLLSKFLYFDGFSFLYPLYSKVMILSSDLDENDRVWKSR
jgi:hypothetical protein